MDLLTYQEWLAGLRARNKVAILTSRQTPSIATIKRLTKTQVVTETVFTDGRRLEQKFRRKDGKRVGYGVDTWGTTPTLGPITAEVRDARFRARALLVIDGTKFHDMRTATLRAVASLIEGDDETGGTDT